MFPHAHPPGRAEPGEAAGLPAQQGQGHQDRQQVTGAMLSLALFMLQMLQLITVSLVIIVDCILIDLVVLFLLIQPFDCLSPGVSLFGWLSGLTRVSSV